MTRTPIGLLELALDICTAKANGCDQGDCSCGEGDDCLAKGWEKFVPAQQRVYLVVDRSFGQRLTALAKVGHVWAVASAVNSPVIQAFWQDDRADKEAELMGPGITAFQEMYVGEPKERLCARLSEELDIHHGEGSGHAPWHEIEVFGVTLTDELRTRFGDLGGQTFVPTPEGFICRRENALLDDDVR